jgi:ribosomal protein S18 acetylase RimI-like enzyme
MGLEQISIEVLPDWDQAFHLFGKLGFQKVAHLPGFVKDREGTISDLVIMVKYLS